MSPCGFSCPCVDTLRLEQSTCPLVGVFVRNSTHCPEPVVCQFGLNKASETPLPL